MLPSNTYLSIFKYFSRMSHYLQVHNIIFFAGEKIDRQMATFGEKTKWTASWIFPVFSPLLSPYSCVHSFSNQKTKLKKSTTLLAAVRLYLRNNNNNKKRETKIRNGIEETPAPFLFREKGSFLFNVFLFSMHVSAYVT